MGIKEEYRDFIRNRVTSPNPVLAAGTNKGVNIGYFIHKTDTQYPRINITSIDTDSRFLGQGAPNKVIETDLRLSITTKKGVEFEGLMNGALLDKVAEDIRQANIDHYDDFNGFTVEVMAVTDGEITELEYDDTRNIFVIDMIVKISHIQ